MRSLALAVVVLLSGCDLYFTDGGDDICNQPVRGTGQLLPEQQLRDPQTGLCQGFGNPYPCDGTCGPCAETTGAMPDWGSCFSQCEGLAEDSCVTTPGCFAAYTDFPTADQAPSFRGCWQTAPSGPVQGSCQNLDAQQCSRHDNCSAHYVDQAGGTKFLTCTAEKAAATVCQSDAECASDQRCTAGVEECNPAPGCAPGQACPAVCYGHCVAKTTPPVACETLATEAACVMRSDCEPIYKGDNCTCTPSSCTCQILTYEHCATK